MSQNIGTNNNYKDVVKEEKLLFIYLYLQDITCK